MRARIQAVIDIVQAAFRSWSDHRAIRFGAGLAYYWLFAVVPLALLAIHLASAFFSVSDIASWLLEVANEISSDGLSMELREFLTAMITETQDTVFTWGAAIVAAVSASFAFAATQDALNMVWDSPKIHGFGHTLRRRLALFVAAVAVASLLIVALLVNAIVGAIEDLLPGRLLDQTIEVVSSFAVYAMIIGLTTLAYRYMPRPSVPWRPSLTPESTKTSPAWASKTSKNQ